MFHHIEENHMCESNEISLAVRESKAIKSTMAMIKLNHSSRAYVRTYVRVDSKTMW